ncbi:sulfite exporter TauE/SafE family protein [Halogeometricum sp. S1BR25-6]|uniref:Probable membrane transporter protein n=1 Tax=Halogeometricum salsisoli TaxID=2950536 RepID=A0ABU2GJQ2_9EURY|nr:sulfite exporter TauE/SafE family protein [Halogeometricum sp. S1BR25-6]MDS0301053.1 sulfite exporter TauE/SafE family protein [Halogeometricum sp. S1BR25-6]
MDILGLTPMMVGIFVGFGLLIGILFGFFGMGGSFLVTPALLVMGYPSTVAVGSGLAFVFGTSVIGALRHRDHGQVDYKLALIMTVAMTVGIEGGKSVVFFLDSTGMADLIISISYVGLLAVVGLFTLRDAWGSKGTDSTGHNLADRVQSLHIPPMVTLRGDVRVSGTIIFAVGLVIGVLSGFLGVGGGFLLMPAMMYGLGVPAAVAVGTDILQITISGAFGAFRYAQSGSVALPVVGALLAGSALGARIGAGATQLVEEDAIKGYFAAMLLAGSVAVAAKELGAAYGIEVLNTVSIALIFGAAVLVSGAVVLAAVCRLRNDSMGTWCRLTTS